METDFCDLDQHFFIMEDLYAVCQRGEAVNHFVMCAPRPTDALLFFYRSRGICTPKGGAPFPVQRGDIMYLPRGSEYRWEVYAAEGEERAVNLLFEFSLYPVPMKRAGKGVFRTSAGDGVPIRFGPDIRRVAQESGGRYEELFFDLITAVQAEGAAPLPACTAAYRLLQTVAKDHRRAGAMRGSIALIREGIALLESEEGEREPLARVAARCGVSVSYFEKLFRRFAGKSPTAYRTARRIAQAKRYLADSDMTLDEIAERLGLYDSAHLCRLFRRETGITPHAYRAAARRL